MNNSFYPHRIIFFGTSDFAIPALQKLHASGFRIQGVVTQPDKPKGRKQKLAPSPVKLQAIKLNLPVRQYESLKKEEVVEEIKSFDAEVAIVSSYGKIIPVSVLTAFPKGCVNLHPSLLPKYRGPSPIQSALLTGEKSTGVSIMVLDAELDHGPIMAQKKVKILETDNYSTLHDKLAEKSADLLLEILSKYLEGIITLKPQAHKQATFTKLLTREDGRIDWKRSAKEICYQIRALTPWPGTWTTMGQKRIKIWAAQPKNIKNQSLDIDIGEIVVQNEKIVVGCGLSSALEITDLQLEGAAKIPSSEFLHRNMLSGIRFV